MKKNEVDALRELKSMFTNKFDGVDLILYGSKARGDFAEFSDLDVLVLTGTEVNNDLEEKIFNFSFKIELKYDVIFGIVVYSKVFWNSIIGNSMPLHWNIDKEGIDLESILNEY
ncbi:MAG: nucleotidyltransferase family protein [Candidatus Humimicrobiaceae bacterium]